MPAEKGWAVASIRCIRVVLYQDAPHLLIGYTLKADGASESTRAAIGLFGLDGAPVVVHKAEGKHGVDILAQSPDGEFLAWRAGGLPIVATVTDFVTGQNWSPLQTSPYASLVFDNNKFSTNTALAARSNLYSVGNALLGPQYRLRDGKLQKVDSSAWARAVKGDDGDDEFTVYMAAGDGQIACFGPGSSEAPHLCFVDVDSASVLMVQPLTQEIVRLFLENNTLYIVNDSEMVSMPWPSLEQFSDAIQTRKDEPALPYRWSSKNASWG